MSYDLQKIREKAQHLNLPAGQHIFVGGASLASYGIRETKDLDIVVSLELFDKLIQEGWELDDVYKDKWNRRRIKREDIEIYPDLYLEKQDVFVDIKELINNANIIDGIPFQPLEHLIMCKLDSGREKDLEDIALINKFIEGSRQGQDLHI